MMFTTHARGRMLIGLLLFSYSNQMMANAGWLSFTSKNIFKIGTQYVTNNLWRFSALAATTIAACSIGYLLRRDCEREKRFADFDIRVRDIALEQSATADAAAIFLAYVSLKGAQEFNYDAEQIWRGVANKGKATEKIRIFTKKYGFTPEKYLPDYLAQCRNASTYIQQLVNSENS